MTLIYPLDVYHVEDTEFDTFMFRFKLKIFDMGVSRAAIGRFLGDKSLTRNASYKHTVPMQRKIVDNFMTTNGRDES